VEETLQAAACPKMQVFEDKNGEFATVWLLGVNLTGFCP